MCYQLYQYARIHRRYFIPFLHITICLGVLLPLLLCESGELHKTYLYLLLFMWFNYKCTDFDFKLKMVQLFYLSICSIIWIRLL
ncbi:unnamed protein product [Schistosoma curassoni]|uniref:Ovule protein n=1 Tax=Schistosoma curassoni TaxID=6186 RepID=A0A183JPC6_9TREM|nr:unnamed protein product [Schistosoma curassoni]